MVTFHGKMLVYQRVSGYMSKPRQVLGLKNSIRFTLGETMTDGMDQDAMDDFHDIFHHIYIKYPLVIEQKTMERSTMLFFGKIIYVYK